MKKKVSTVVFWVFLVGAFFALFNAGGSELPTETLDSLQADLTDGQVSVIYVSSQGDMTVDRWDGMRYRVPGPPSSALRAEVLESGMATIIDGDPPNPVRSLLMIAIPLLVVVLLFIWFLKRAQGGTANVIALTKSRARLIKESSVRFTDVGGATEAKERLGDVIDFLKHPKRWEAAGVRLPRGVLLDGPPGCGKTLLARAVAGEAGVPFYLVSASEFVEMFVGVGAARVRDMFEEAEKSAPAVVFIDELDAVGRRRGSGIGSGHDEREQTLNQILVCLDGFQNDTRVVVIAATNRADILDRALLRPGRFDVRVQIPPPTPPERLDILRIHGRDKPLADDVTLEYLADRTDGYSGAALEHLCNEAGLRALRRLGPQVNGGLKIALEDFEHILDLEQKRTRRFNKLDAALIESTTQLSQPAGVAEVQLTLNDGSVVEGRVVWVDSVFIKLIPNDQQRGELLVAKAQVRTLEALRRRKKAAARTEHDAGLRLLASSRVALDDVLGVEIGVGPLDPDSSLKLFKKCWNGGKLPKKKALRDFLDAQLGGHSLGITLLARLGRAYSWETLTQRWNAQGTALAKTRKPDDRLDSLQISFELTVRLLADRPDALDLWQFIALFPEGLDEKSVEYWNQVNDQTDPQRVLAEHHLIGLDGNHITMLPPIARYATDNATGDNEAAAGFDWSRARSLAYTYFLDLSRDASSTISSSDNIVSRSKTSRQLWAIERLFATELSFRSSDGELARKLHRQLENVYPFNVLAGQTALARARNLIGDGLAFVRSGDLEKRLGNLEQARLHYDQAIELYQLEQDQLGLANALRALGDLQKRLGNLEPARLHYDQALELYQLEQDQLGLANALQALGDLESRLGNLEPARLHYDQAIELYHLEQAKLGLANALKALGDLEKRLGNLEPARLHYDQAIELYQLEQAKLGLANALKALGDLKTRLGNLEPARLHYDQAIELYQLEQDQLGLANALRALGDLESRLGNLEPARLHYDQAIELYHLEQAKLGLANALKALGDLEKRLGNLEPARLHYDQAIELYQSEQAKLGLANALTALGDLETRLGNLEPARLHYDQAIELYQSEQAKLGLANALRALGDLQKRLGNLEPARQHYDQAIELYQLEQDQLGLANALKALGDLESRLGNLEPARLHYDQAIELYHLEQAKLGLANALKALGDLETRLSNLEPARQHYDQAIELYQLEQDQLGLANALQALGDLETRLGNLEPARLHYDQAIELYQLEQAKLGLANALQSLGDLETRLGNLEPARQHYDQAIELYQSEQAKLGLANVLQALGDLHLSTNANEEALICYEEALDLYRAEQEPIGQAYTLSEILRCRVRLKDLEQDELLSLTPVALSLAQRSGVESVIRYVLGALHEACGGDEEKLKALLGEIDNSGE